MKPGWYWFRHSEVELVNIFRPWKQKHLLSEGWTCSFKKWKKKSPFSCLPLSVFFFPPSCKIGLSQIGGIKSISHDESHYYGKSTGSGGERECPAFVNLHPAGIRFIYASGRVGGDHPEAVYHALFASLTCSSRSSLSTFVGLWVYCQNCKCVCNSGSPSPSLESPEWTLIDK